VEKKVSSLPVKSEKLIESSEKVDSPEHIEAKESDKT
jgi:hypothetical protein